MLSFLQKPPWTFFHLPPPTTPPANTTPPLPRVQNPNPLPAAAAGTSGPGHPTLSFSLADPFLPLSLSDPAAAVNGEQGWRRRRADRCPWWSAWFFTLQERINTPALPPPASSSCARRAALSSSMHQTAAARGSFGTSTPQVSHSHLSTVLQNTGSNFYQTPHTPAPNLFLLRFGLDRLSVLPAFI